MKRGAIVILLFSVSLASMALEYPCDSAAMQPLRPRLQYSVDALFYFDNREYKAPWQNDQTLFAIRLSPEIGVGFTDKRGGVHRVMAGVSYKIGRAHV